MARSIALDQEQLLAEARAWMEQNYPQWLEHQPELYYARLRLLVDFVIDLTEPNA